MTSNRRTFLKELGFGASALAFAPWFSGCRTIAPILAANGLPRSTPEAQGVSSGAIQDFLDAIAASKHEVHSFMVVRHGHVIAEGWWAPYAPELNHTMYSMSKSFTSTAVGLAVAEGKLRVDDPVVSFFPGDAPEKISDELAALKVKHLLTMSAGHAKEPTSTMIKEENWARVFLGWPIAHAPGSTFLYNSGCSYMLSAIVQKVTGQRVVDYLKPRLFAPLGIDNATWDTDPRGINVGGWGLNIRTEGLAKFGQLYLQKGRWKDQQIIPAAWVEEATTFKIQQPLPSTPARPNEENDWLQGYCYQFWRCTHHAFRGDGAFGQFTVVMPDQDAVVIITSETSNLQGELDLVWKHLLPAMKDGVLPADGASERRLRASLKSLALPPPKGSHTSPTAARVTDRTFTLGANDLGLRNGSFTFTNDTCRFTLRDDKAAYPILCGIEKWRFGETALPGTPPNLVAIPPKPGTLSKVAASGTWKDAATFEIVLRYYETPHHDTVTCRFDPEDKEKVEVSFMSSLAAMSANPKDKRPVLTGTLAPRKLFRARKKRRERWAP